jgi:hypothetical protein
MDSEWLESSAPNLPFRESWRSIRSFGEIENAMVFGMWWEEPIDKTPKELIITI